jgi:DNA-directed RNA polymerase specialized sigma24 family protein
VPDNPDRFRKPEEIERALAHNRRQREAAQLELEGEREVLQALLVRGRIAGLTVAAMARAAGISRETAHKLLRKARQPRTRGGTMASA